MTESHAPDLSSCQMQFNVFQWLWPFFCQQQRYANDNGRTPYAAHELLCWLASWNGAFPHGTTTKQRAFASYSRSPCNNTFKAQKQTLSGLGAKRPWDYILISWARVCINTDIYWNSMLATQYALFDKNRPKKSQTRLTETHSRIITPRHVRGQIG